MRIERKTMHSLPCRIIANVAVIHIPLAVAGHHGEDAKVCVPIALQDYSNPPEDILSSVEGVLDVPLAGVYIGTRVAFLVLERYTGLDVVEPGRCPVEDGEDTSGSQLAQPVGCGF